MKRSWAALRDELERTVFAGQTALDGSVAQETTVAPRALAEPERTCRTSGEQAVETVGQSLLFDD